jgi:hypothetical protein
VRASRALPATESTTTGGSRSATCTYRASLGWAAADTSDRAQWVHSHVPGGFRRAQPAGSQTQRPGPAAPPPPVVFWSFCQRCNKAFAQQLYAVGDTRPETLCSQRCGRGRTQDAAVQRARSVSDGLRP